MPEDMMQTLVGGVVVLIFGVIILNQVGGISGGPGVVDGQARLATDIEINPPVDTLLDVQETLGTAAAFDGSASAGLSGQIPQPPVGDTELCTFTTITDTDRNSTIANADGGLALEYHGNRTTPQWVAVRYDRGDRVTEAVSTATTDATNRTHVCAREDSGNLVLNVNGTDEANQSITSDDEPLAAVATQSLNGTVDETRLYETSLNSTQRTTIRTTPTAPASGVTPSARLYYDSRAGIGSQFDSTPIYFAASTASLKGATVADGVSGRSVDSSDIVISAGGSQASAADGSELDGNPVAFIRYESPGIASDSVLATLEAALQFAPIALMAMLAAGILVMLRNGGRA